MSIEDLYASAWDNAIEQTAEFINKFGFNYTYQDWRVLEPFAICNGLDFDENGYLISNEVKASKKFTKYPQGYVRASSNTGKVLKIRDGERIKTYEYRYESESGTVFEPKAGSGNWWTSYIVTPDNKLLSWDFNGQYYPCSDIYGKDFWVE